MPEITEVTLELGRDRYNRRVTARRMMDGGHGYWTLTSDPINQRDEGEITRSLTDENMRELARCLDRLSRSVT